MHTVLLRAQKSQRVNDALCAKTHPHMSLAPTLPPLTLLPAQMLCGGSDVHYVDLAEATSDNGSDQPIADVVVVTDVPVLGASSMSVSAAVVSSHVSKVPAAASRVFLS